MIAPWDAFPQLARNSIGWRMGPGEEAYSAFYRAYSNLNESQRAAYEADHAEPPDWTGLYATIRAHP